MTLGGLTGETNLRPEMTAEEKQWFEEELKEQVARYEKIVKQMDDLTEQREKWVAEFTQRIQSRGFHWHAENRRVIPKEEIRPRDSRPLQVVY
ncbi:MAG: hypothetical protein CMM25_00945 [Rhodospirillaceae bacterium]|nr:hypothetical protein [Rhodospirillaceae bacterium]|tara:strand:- start:87 stop:365 length:279 start_codon:yes stop_codon:yes gene_type:complete